jgi:hypothetical protein
MNTTEETKPMTEVEERDKVINTLSEACNSAFYYQAIPENEVAKCADCFKAAGYYERMKRDRYYRRSLCIECRDKNVERLFLSRQNALRDPYEGRYKITSQQTSARDKRKSQ